MKTFVPSKPHFFKVVWDGFENHLKIPSDFCSSLLAVGRKSRFTVVLRMNGKEWKVDFVFGYFEGDGWSRFARENRLRLCDFLVFRLCKPHKFEVTLFDGFSFMGTTRDGSEGSGIQMMKSRFDTSTSRVRKSFGPIKVSEQVVADGAGPTNHVDATGNVQDRGKRVVIIETSSESDSESKYEDFSIATGGPNPYPYFITTLKHYCFSINAFNIPLRFSRDNELDRKCKMILLDEKRREWDVTVYSLVANVRIMKGWKDFVAANNFQEGETVKFELLSSGEKPVALLSRTEQ